MAIPATTVGGNTWSPPAGNERLSGEISVSMTLAADASNNTFENPLFVVPSYPGNPRLILKQAAFMNGNIISVLNTTVTVKIKNFTNAKKELAAKTLVAADIVDCAGTNYIAAVLAPTAIATTSDRSTSPGGTATTPDVVVFPGDVIYVEIIADASSTIRLGSTVTAIFKPIDVDAVLN